MKPVITGSVGSLLKMLFDQTRRAIEDTRKPDFGKVTITAEVRELQRRWMAAERAQDAIKKRLAKLGLDVQNHDTGDVGIEYSARRRQEQQWNAQQEKRRIRLVQLQIDARTQLLGLDPLKTRRYIQTLVTRLKAI